MKTQNIYFSLEAQLNKLARHNRQGSYRTKERYYMAMKRFCHFIADAYRLQKLSNFSGKHLVAYVLWMQEKELSASTIKTDLAAIRFFHDKISNPKYKLPSNAELGVELERRRFGDTDRTWSVAEFNRLLGKALDREDYILAFYLARYAGLRIHECFRIDTAIARQAIREGAITIKGKGGNIRTVPINQQYASHSFPEKPLLQLHAMRGIISPTKARAFCMHKVLFVCHGNICRSPMAEFVMKDMVAKAGASDKFYIASRGVSREEEGNPVYPAAQRELARHSIGVSHRAARKITEADCKEFDHIFYMDASNGRALARLFPTETKFRPFLSHDVADPWYYGNFDRTFADIVQGCKQILEELIC